MTSIQTAFISRQATFQPIMRPSGQIAIAQVGDSVSLTRSGSGSASAQAALGQTATTRTGTAQTATAQTASTQNAVASLATSLAPAALGMALKVAAVPSGVTGAALAAMIDHTLLKPEASANDIRKLCAEAREFGFASVCVNPGRVTLAAELLRGSSVKVCTVVGFPLGATTTASKAAETRDAIANGAHEIDMVINVGALKEGDHDRVRNDIRAVVDAAQGHTVKVILETGLLTREEKITACHLTVEAGANFVKTSTGFGPGVATVEDIALMRATVGPDFGVKASGGVRDFATAQAMIAAGATRIGTSSGIAILQGGPASSTGY